MEIVHQMQMHALRRHITLSRYIVGLFVVGVVSLYFVNFIFHYGLSLSDSTDAWGQFGDYVGGLLNPVVAFFAFYWLTASVMIQKEELAQTKSALRDAANAQNAQARHAERTAIINALAATLQSLDSDISNFRNDIELISAQVHSRGDALLPSGTQVNRPDAIQAIYRLNDQLEAAVKQRAAIRVDIKKEIGIHDGAKAVGPTPV